MRNIPDLPDCWVIHQQGHLLLLKIFQRLRHCGLSFSLTQFSPIELFYGRCFIKFADFKKKINYN